MNLCKNCVYFWSCIYVNTRQSCEWQKAYLKVELERIDEKRGVMVNKEEAMKILKDFIEDKDIYTSLRVAIETVLQESAKKDKRIAELQTMLFSTKTSSEIQTAIEIMHIKREGYIEGEQYQYKYYVEPLLRKKQELINKLKEDIENMSKNIFVWEAKAIKDYAQEILEILEG